MAHDHAISSALLWLLGLLLAALGAAVEADLADQKDAEQDYHGASDQVDDHVDGVEVVDVAGHKFLQRLPTTFHRATVIYVAVKVELKWLLVLDPLADARALMLVFQLFK